MVDGWIQVPSKLRRTAASYIEVVNNSQEGGKRMRSVRVNRHRSWSGGGHNESVSTEGCR